MTLGLLLLVIAAVLFLVPLAASPWPIVAIAGAVAAAIGLSRLRHERAAEFVATAEASNLEARFAALEQRLAQMQDITASVSIEVGHLSERLSDTELARRVSESIIIALRDTGVREQPKTELERALHIISELAGGKKELTPWYQRASGWLTVSGAVVTLAVTSLGLVGSLEMWRPNRPPVVSGVTAPARAVAGQAVEVQVEATDPDGQGLTYSYSVTQGLLAADGPVALWTPPPGSAGGLVNVEVRVGDGEHQAVATKTIRVNSPPEVTLDVPPPGHVGSPLRLGVTGQDPDGDHLEISWNISCGTLQPDTGAIVFLRLADGCSPHVVTTVSDGWQSVTLEGDLARGP